MFGFPRRAQEPRITREDIVVEGRIIEITRRPYKRSLNLTLKLNGRIRVSAPKGLTLTQIHDFVVAQEEWIQAQLEKCQSYRRAHPKKEMKEGEEFPFLGERLLLTYEPCAGKPAFKIRDGKLVCGVRREVWHCFDPNSPHPELLPSLGQFYKKVARELLSERAAEYSNRMNLYPFGLSFRAPKTRWGSCSPKGRITFNWKLIFAPLEVIDYIVVHELAHLQFLNHSSKFWALVTAHSPNWREHRNWLRTHQFDADFLARESELHPAN